MLMRFGKREYQERRKSGPKTGFSFVIHRNFPLYGMSGTLLTTNNSEEHLGCLLPHLMICCPKLR